MRRFTVSLPDDLYAALRLRGEQAVPPASLQQMIRFAVDSMLTRHPAHGEVSSENGSTAEVGFDTAASVIAQADLLVFSVREVTYGMPIELVETVAASLPIHGVPTSSGSLLGVAPFRDSLTEVHDGGTVLQGLSLDQESPSLLAIPGRSSRVLLTVSSVTGLVPAADLQWSAAPDSSPPWVAALAWGNGDVIAVVAPAGFNL